MTQFLRPTADEVPDSWVGQPNDGTLFNKINEIVRNDSDWITGPGDNAACTLTLSLPVQNPFLPGSLIIHWTAARAVNNQSATVTMKLLQGATVIKSLTLGPLSSAFIQQDYTLTNAEVASITDFTNMKVQFTDFSVNGAGKVSWFEFELPYNFVNLKGVIPHK